MRGELYAIGLIGENSQATVGERPRTQDVAFCFFWGNTMDSYEKTLEYARVKGRLVLGTLNLFTQYRWTIRYRDDQVEFNLTVPHQHGSFGGCYVVGAVELAYTASISAMAQQIFNAVAMDFAIHYLRQPTARYHRPSVEDLVATLR